MCCGSVQHFLTRHIEMNIFDNAIRALLSPDRFGGYLYRRYPALGRAWGGPMNGQVGRCKLVADLILRGDFAAIIETGTYRGTTTEWLSAFGVPIFTCELSLENVGFARARLSGIPDITLLQMDSRSALRHILSGQLVSKADQPILFYLDAHWNDGLPLNDEIDIIYSTHREAVVLVDDFCVPDDPGYGYDDYGAGKALTLEYITSVISRHELACRLPSIQSDAETGAKRGCVVISQKSANITTHLYNITYLRLAPSYPVESHPDALSNTG